MAAIWTALRQEISATVDDFREKGAIGALRDAALDAKELTAETGGWLWGGVKTLVVNDAPVVYAERIPTKGTEVTVEFPDGTAVVSSVVDVDGVSEPPRLRVLHPGVVEPIVVQVVIRTGDEAKEGGTQMPLFDGIKQELRATVEDIRQKGAVTALKEAASDAKDIIGSTVTTAVSTVQATTETLATHIPSMGAEAEPSSDGTDATHTQGARPEDDEAPGTMQNLFSGLKQEFRDTVQEFRDKGAVGALKDAALDAVDMAKSAGDMAVTSVKTIAATAGTAITATGEAALPAPSTEDTKEEGAVPAASAPPEATTAAAVPAPVTEGNAGKQADLATSAAPEATPAAAVPAHATEGNAEKQADLAAPAAPEATPAAAVPAPAADDKKEEAGDLAAAAASDVEPEAAVPAPATEDKSEQEAVVAAAVAPEAKPEEATGKAANSGSRWGGGWFGWGNKGAASEPTPPAAASTGDAPIGSGSNAAEGVKEEPEPKMPVFKAKESEAPEKPGRKSLVSMRKKMFDKKQDDEEMID